MQRRNSLAQEEGSFGCQRELFSVAKFILSTKSFQQTQQIHTYLTLEICVTRWQRLRTQPVVIATSQDDANTRREYGNGTTGTSMAEVPAFRWGTLQQRLYQGPRVFHLAVSPICQLNTSIHVADKIQLSLWFNIILCQTFQSLLRAKCGLWPGRSTKNFCAPKSWTWMTVHVYIYIYMYVLWSFISWLIMP